MFPQTNITKWARKNRSPWTQGDKPLKTFKYREVKLLFVMLPQTNTTK